MQSIQPEKTLSFTQDCGSSVIGAICAVRVLVSITDAIDPIIDIGDDLFSLHKINIKQRKEFNTGQLKSFRNEKRDPQQLVDSLIMGLLLRESFESEIETISSYGLQIQNALFVIERAYSTIHHLTPLVAEIMMRSVINRFLNDSGSTYSVLIEEYLNRRFRVPEEILYAHSGVEDHDLWAFEILGRKYLGDSIVAADYRPENLVDAKYEGLFQTFGVTDWGKKLITSRQNENKLADLNRDFLLACLEESTEEYEFLGTNRCFASITYDKDLVDKLLLIFDLQGHPVRMNARKCLAATNLIRMKAIETFPKVREIIQQCCPLGDDKRIESEMIEIESDM